MSLRKSLNRGNTCNEVLDGAQDALSIQVQKKLLSAYCEIETVVTEIKRCRKDHKERLNMALDIIGGFIEEDVFQGEHDGEVGA